MLTVVKKKKPMIYDNNRLENINNYLSKQDFIFLIFLYNYVQLKWNGWFVPTPWKKSRFKNYHYIENSIWLFPYHIPYQPETPKHANNILLVFNVVCILCCDVALWLNVIDLSLACILLWFVVERIPGIDSISCGRFDQFNH